MSTSTLKPIILYDIPSVVPGQPWFVNTMKPRYCLTFKGLPFETVWLEFPEIRPFCEENSLVPTQVVINGTTQPVHTLPVIMDPNTNRFISESFAIARYLDEQYPDTPKVLPRGTTALIHVLHNSAFNIATGGMSQGLITFRGAEKLNPVSKEFYTRTRTERSGIPWEEYSPPEKREQQLNDLRAMCDTVDGWYVKSSGQFILGDVPSFVDFTVAGRFKWMQYIFEEQEWEEVKNWNGGRWEKLIEATDKYFSV